MHKALEIINAQGNIKKVQTSLRAKYFSTVWAIQMKFSIARMKFE